ncbi:uncharacterized protein KIAA1755 isoform X3 [Homo sapiens]|uniref:uncharacterized protein KIAA1755 isoform X3 n=1 Tax=Homo sapiens TaxID=9606 RepID=UPI000D0C8C18|nr:uncharacterized protein KIAA1755 isoform X3 [Homo sapiens]|eukprot:XP_024307778.1 uncharacterized protein KIAA1755 isoform X3 [Homo sapiens]
MDPPSLDTAIQHALAGLYPPFEATAPTVLGQVFRLLDSGFQGDGLSFLLDFLIPAKRLCEQVREAACAPYSHCLFLHEGWPLCLRDEVVVHLAPLNPLLLRQGDFYLQVEPQEEQSVCIMIKCLSLDLCTVDKKPVPEPAYPILFTQEWLEAINSDFEGNPLHNCLVASENGIAPVPWTKITSPEFVDDRPQVVNALCQAWGPLPLEALDLSSPQELHQASSPDNQVLPAQSLAKGKGRTYGSKYPGLIKVEQARCGEVAFRMDEVVSQDFEGDYVALLGFSQESRGESPSREAGTSSGCTSGALEEIAGTKETPLFQKILPLSEANEGPSLGNRACTKPESSEERPYNLGFRRKVNLKAPTHNSERPPQGSYMNVLEDALDCASGLRAGVSQEPAASKMQGPLGNPENMVQLRPGPRQASSPRLSPASPAAAASETKIEVKTKERNGRLPKPMPCPSRNTSSPEPPTPGLKFSFLRGQRQPSVTPEKASLQHNGPWKVLCSLYSPKPNRAKSLGKAGTTQTKTSGPATAPSPLTEEKAALPEASAGSPERGPTLEEEPPGPEPRIGALGVKVFRSRIACLPGGRDRAGRPLLLVSTTEGAWEAPWCTVSEVTKLLSYLCTIPRPEDKAKGLAVLIDARRQPPQPGLVSALQATQKLDPFLADLHQASSLLQASIEEFEKADPPGGMQEATRCLSKSKELMEAVLRDPGLLGLQREGGATLARLQHDASRLDFSPDVRSHLAAATALYSLVDEQLHVLVTASNSLLGKLELRVRLGRLEAAIHQVSDWMEQEGRRCLQSLTPKDGSLETVEKAHAEFENFFLQAAAQYRRGLELSKQAAQLGATARGAGEAERAEFPELAAFASTQRAFQAELTHFYMAAERQRTDLETLLHLHRFCKRMTWFHMDCQDLMAQLRLDKTSRVSPGDQRRLHRYLQRLASEFPAEKLAAVGLQVASLSRAGLGQELWEEARIRHEEIRMLLEKALTHSSCPEAPAAHSARPERRGVAAKGQGVSVEVTSKGRWDQPPLDSLGMDHLPKSYWPPGPPRGEQNRTFQAGSPPQEAGQAAEAEDGKGSHKLPDPAREHLLATTFFRQQPPRQSQVPRLTGGSFSSEGTDSQTSLEDSPQTSPLASL